MSRLQKGLSLLAECVDWYKRNPPRDYREARIELLVRSDGVEFEVTVTPSTRLERENGALGRLSFDWQMIAQRPAQCVLWMSETIEEAYAATSWRPWARGNSRESFHEALESAFDVGADVVQ